MAFSTQQRDELLRVMVAAGTTACARQENLRVSEKPDHTLVTNADTEIERYVIEQTTAIAPHTRHIGEETIEQHGMSYIEQSMEHDCWIIDPIDGTAPFAAGLDTWGVSIGYAQHGIITVGYLFVPRLGLLLYTEDQTAMCLDIGRIPQQWTSKLATATPYQLTRENNRKKNGMISISQDCARYGRFDTTIGIQSVGSCVYSVAQYLLGSYRSIVTHVKLWDIAAGIALLVALGAKILDVNRQPVTATIADSFVVDSKETLFTMPGYIVIADSYEECERLLDAIHISYPH